MQTVDGIEIESRITEWGVKGPLSGEVLDCNTEYEARTLADAFESNATVVMRQVFVTAWGEPAGVLV